MPRNNHPLTASEENHRSCPGVVRVRSLGGAECGWVEASAGKTQMAWGWGLLEPSLLSAPGLGWRESGARRRPWREQEHLRAPGRSATGQAGSEREHLRGKRSERRGQKVRARSDSSSEVMQSPCCHILPVAREPQGATGSHRKPSFQGVEKGSPLLDAE